MYKRFPFDTKHPLGFTVALIVEFINLQCLAVFVLGDMLMGIESCVMLISIANDIAVELRSINENASSECNHLFVLNQLIKFIKLHTKAKQLSNFILFNLKIISM